MSCGLFRYPVIAACVLAASACVTVPQEDPAAARRAELALAQAREAQVRAAQEAQAREARRLAELERERAAAEERRRQEVQAGAITPREPILAQPLEATVDKPTAAPEAEARVEKPRLASRAPAALDHGALALQLSRDLRALRSEVETLQTLHAPRGWVLSVDAAELFAPGEAALMPGAERKLDPLARVLGHYAARGIVIEPQLPAEEQPAEVSAQRAQAVRAGLASFGVPAERIAARATGERVEFLVPNDPASGAAAGR